MAYSMDLRMAAVNAYRSSNKTIEEVANLFNIGVRTLKTWLAREQEGALARIPNPGRPCSLNEDQHDFIRNKILNVPDIRLIDLCREISDRYSIHLTESAMCRIVSRLGFRRKKKSYRPEETLREDVKKKRDDFLSVMQTLPMKKLIFIDESSSYLNDPCLYGRSLKGDRVLSHKSTQSRTMISLIGAVALTGIVSIMYGVWNTTGDIFKTFIRKYLMPNLKKGQIVVLDNARIHKVEGIKSLIESTGARLLFLPPYSPDFSPIELMWSKLKNYLRRNTTGSLAEYHQALLDGLHEINDEDFEAWYDHCGYSASI